MFYQLIILIYTHQQLLFFTASASSLLFTLDHVRYSLSDRVLNIPKLGALRALHIDYEHQSYRNYHLVNVEAFLGIQYGLYHGRFEPSKERFQLQLTSKVNKQIDFGPACAQHIWTNETELKHIRTETFARDYYPKLLKYVQHQNEEQCLYMNIYQPQIKDLKEALPVLLLVHGDGYDMSTGSAFDGALFASYTRTIVVTINYRLGPFGFLYLSRENKGDYALQDIYTALHWLKNYVTHFNGDPDRITLYGTGSGGVLASLVVMLETVNGGTGSIKRRKSLVHRLILNDQTFLSPSMTSVHRDLNSNHHELLAQFSCSTVICLRNQTRISTEQLLRLNTYAKEVEYENYLNPVEYPFPFLNHLEMKNSSINPIRMKFFHHSQALLPDPLPILLTISSSKDHPLVHQSNFKAKNSMIENLVNYAYTKWNNQTKEYQFDQYLFHYHEQILAPLLKYAQHLPKHRPVHLLERQSNRFGSELPFSFGYVLAPSMSVFNETYLNASEQDREESMTMMDLFANLIHQGDINIQSPFCQRKQCHSPNQWNPIFPEFNSILINDGHLSQIRGDHSQVHYLFNNMIFNLTDHSTDTNLINAWKTLYEVSAKSNQTKILVPSTFLSKGFFPFFDLNLNHEKYLLTIFLSSWLLFVINMCLCIVIIKRGCLYRKRHYNCLNTHKQLKTDAQHHHHGGSSPSSTNSNGTITIDSTQHLIVNTTSHDQEHHPSPLSSLLCTTTTTTNSSSNSTSPIDILHPNNIIKKNGILKCSTTSKKMNALISSSLPEAVV